MQKHFNRRDRRSYMKSAGILYAKAQLREADLYKYFEINAQNIVEGNKIHAEFVDEQEKQQITKLEAIDASMRESFTKAGLSEKRIADNMEAWYKAIEKKHVIK